METLVKADIFFFITSIAIIVVSLFVLIVIVYVIITIKKFNVILERVERELAGTNAYVQEMLEDVRESKVYTFLFHRKRNRAAKHHENKN